VLLRSCCQLTEGAPPHLAILTPPFVFTTETYALSSHCQELWTGFLDQAAADPVFSSVSVVSSTA
jgi:hypothetical protein